MAAAFYLKSDLCAAAGTSEEGAAHLGVQQDCREKWVSAAGGRLVLVSAEASSLSDDELKSEQTADNRGAFLALFLTISNYSLSSTTRCILECSI